MNVNQVFTGNGGVFVGNVFGGTVQVNTFVNGVLTSTHGGGAARELGEVVEHFTVPGNVAKLHLRIDSGDVTIRPGAPGSDVQITQTLRSADGTAQGSYMLEPRDGDVLYIRGDSPEFDDRTDFAIAIPPGASVDAYAGAGLIDISGITGTIDAASTSADIAVAAAPGRVGLETVSGDVRGRGLGPGTVFAKSTSGDIDLALANDANVQAATISGDVRVDVPSGGAYRTSIRSVSGRTDDRVGSTPGATNRVDASSVSGDVTVTAH